MQSRIILLGDDGRHVTLGRYSAPTEPEVAQVEAKLAASGQGGWIASMTGNYYARRGKLRIEAIREVAKPRKGFTEALVEFCRIRKGATQ